MAAEQRYSQKREAIREELRRAKDHPGAETLYARLKPRYPDLSLGTVYRNLSAFLELEEIRCVATVDGVERFDADLHPHAHFVCEKCGRVIDIENGVPPASPEEALPGQVRSYSLTYYGICNDCQKEYK